MTEKVTIHDVAQEAGVSVGTVYRAVHNTGRIREETRRRVLETVARLGYKPNSVARGLALRNRFTILAVLPKEPSSFWNDVHKGMRRAAARLSEFGVQTVEFIHNGGIAGGKRIADILSGQKIDAMAVSPVGISDIDEILALASRTGTAVALLNEETQGSDRLLFYGPDNRMAGRMAAELVTKTTPPGRAFLAVSSAEYPSGQTVYREEGFAEYLRLHGCGGNFMGFYRCTEEECSDLLRRKLGENPDIGGIYFVQFMHLVKSLAFLRGLTRKPAVTGHEYHGDFAAALREGTIASLLVQEKVCQGYYPLMMLYRYLAAGEKPSRERYYSNINVILESNRECLLHSENGCGYE